MDSLDDTDRYSFRMQTTQSKVDGHVHHDDDDQLIRDEEDVDSGKLCFVGGKFKYHIELVLLAFSAFINPLFNISSQYVIVKVAEELDYNITEFSSNFSACSNVSKDDPNYILSQKVEADAAMFMMYLQGGTTVPTVFMSLYLGGISDRLGRKYAFVTALFGNLGRNVIYTLVIWLNLPKEVLYATILFEGFCGGFEVFYMGCISYISDNSDKESRAKRILIGELCMVIPVALTNLGVGAWVETSGFLMPFAFLSIMNFLVLLYAFFVVPETVQSPANKSLGNPLKDFKKSVSLFVFDDGTGLRLRLLILVAAMLFPEIYEGSSVDTLFMTNTPLCWRSFMISVNVATKIGVSVVGSCVGLKLFRLLHFSDTIIAIISGINMAIGHAYTAFVRNTVMMLMGNVVSLFSFLLVSMIKTLMSTQVKPEDHGAVFAGVAVLQCIADIIGQFLLNPVYASTVYLMHGFVYLVLALFDTIGVIMLVLFFVKQKNG